MADKILVIKVDPCCPCSYKKIKKILCKLQACVNIKTITYDEKNYTVTLSGPFDPQKLSRMILCKACKLIIEIKVVDPPKPPAPPPPKQTINEVCNDIEIIIKDKDPKCTVTKKVIKECIPEKKEKKDGKEEKKDGKEEKKPEIQAINRVCNGIQIIVCPDPPCCPPPPCPPPPCPGPDKCCDPRCCPPPPCPGRDKCRDPRCCPPPPCPRPCTPPCPPPEHCPKPPCPPPCEPPCKPPVCQVCCWAGCSVGSGHQGGSSCYSCGRIYGCVPDCPPMGHRGTPHGGYQVLCEQEPSCTMM